MDPEELPAEGFGDRLKRLVKLRGLNNGDIAQGTGVHIVTVSRWMAGQKPKGEALLDLARLLQISPDILLKGQAPEPLQVGKSGSRQITSKDLAKATPKRRA